MVDTILPCEFSTIRQPTSVADKVTPAVGRLPTITKPDRKATSAVVSPTPPGHGPGNLDALI